MQKEIKMLRISCTWPDLTRSEGPVREWECQGANANYEHVAKVSLLHQRSSKTRASIHLRQQHNALNAQASAEILFKNKTVARGGRHYRQAILAAFSPRGLWMRAPTKGSEKQIDIAVQDTC